MQKSFTPLYHQQRVRDSVIWQIHHLELTFLDTILDQPAYTMLTIANNSD